MVTRDRGGSRDEKQLLDRYRVSFGGDENVLEPDRAGGCTNCHQAVHFTMVLVV